MGFNVKPVKIFNWRHFLAESQLKYLVVHGWLLFNRIFDSDSDETEQLEFWFIAKLNKKYVS